MTAPLRAEKIYTGKERFVKVAAATEYPLPLGALY